MMILEKNFFRGGRFYSVEGSGGYLGCHNIFTPQQKAVETIIVLPQYSIGGYYCAATIFTLQQKALGTILLPQYLQFVEVGGNYRLLCCCNIYASVGGGGYLLLYCHNIYFLVKGGGDYRLLCCHNIYALVEGGGDYLLLCCHNIYTLVEGDGSYYCAATIFMPQYCRRRWGLSIIVLLQYLRLNCNVKRFLTRNWLN